MISGRLPAVVLSAVLGALLLVPNLALAQSDEALELVIRETRLLEEGVTELLVNVTGPAADDVLPASAFVVSEQGEVVTDLEVEPFLQTVGSEVVVVLAIDVSGSMQGDAMTLTKQAATAFARELTELGVQIQLLSFAASVEVLTPPTSDTDTVVQAIAQLEAGGETLLYDAVVVAAAQLEGVTGQRNLVVFSDGGDNGSQASLDDAILSASSVEVPIVTVALETAQLDPEALDAMAIQTGGRVLTAENLTELDAVFAEVGRDIASQYVLRYTSARYEPATLDLAVEVSSGGASASTTFAVSNTREEPQVAATPRVFESSPNPLSNPAVLIAGLVAAFVALLLLFATLFTAARTRGDKVLGEQLAQYIERSDPRAGRSSAVAAHFRDRAMEIFDASPRPKGFDEKLSRRLEQAAWPLRNSEFIALIVVLALGVGLLFGVIFNPLGGILTGAIAGSVPIVILHRRRAKRHDAFLRVLPDTLQLMAGSLRAGYGVLQSIDSVAKESSGPTSQEFGRVLTEARLGMPLEQALEDMADRIENDDFRWVVLAINIQREVGGNLAELLDTVAEVLREREMLRRQIKVLSAEGRLSAIILVGLPIFLAIYLILVRPEYIGVLVTSGLFGWVLVGGGVFLMFVGVFWIRKLIQIEV